MPPVGSITINTKLDNHAVIKGADEMKRSFMRFAQSAMSANNSSGQSMEILKNKIIQTKNAISDVEREMHGISSAATDSGNATSKSYETAKLKVEQTRVALGALDEQMADIANSKQAARAEFFTDPKRLDEEVAKALEVDKAYQKLGTRYDTLSIKLTQQQMAADKAKQSAVASSGTQSAAYKRLETKLAGLNAKLGEQNTKLRVAESSARKTGVGIGALGKSIEKTKNRIASLVAGVFVFNLLRKGFSSLRNYMGEALKTNADFTKSTAQIKGNLATMFQPLLEKAIPILQAFADKLVLVTNYLANLTSRAFGKTVQQSAEAAKKLYAQAKATDKLAKSTKSLAAIDEINQTKNSDDSEKSGVLDTGGATELSDGIKEQMDKIMVAAGVALFAVGAILLFTGANIPLGLGLMAIGAVMFASAIAPMWNAIPDEIQKTIQSIMLVVGAALFVLGVVLAFTGASIPIGIALMVAGAATMAGAIAINPAAIVEAIQGPLGEIMLLLGTALIVIGIILIATGAALPLGVALIVAGAAALVPAVALNFNAIVETITKTLKEVGAVLGLGLLALGAMLIATGVMLPLGIALLAAGAVSLVSAVALNFNAIVDTITNVLKNIGWIIGLSLVAIGVILCVTGVGLPLGIALIVAGVGSLVAAVALNKDEIVNWVKGVLAKVGEAFSMLWDGIKYGAKMAFWGITSALISVANFVLSVINGLIDGIMAPFNVVIDGLNNIPGVSLPKLKIAIPTFALPPMPHLANGAVIPANKEFAAVLGDQKHGTNIETPERLLREIMREELAKLGNDVTLNNTVVLDDGTIISRGRKTYTRDGRLNSSKAVV